jgi:hypothetical protein
MLFEMLSHCSPGQPSWQGLFYLQDSCQSLFRNTRGHLRQPSRHFSSRSSSRPLHGVATRGEGEERSFLNVVHHSFNSTSKDEISVLCLHKMRRPLYPNPIIDIVLTPCYADRPGNLPKCNALQTPVVQCRIRGRLSKVSIRVHLRSVDALEILTLDKRFDPLLDHVDLRLELTNQLAESFKDELLMRKFLALSATC